MNYLVCTRTGRLDMYGAEILKLTRYLNGVESGSIPCRSGGPSKQRFRTANDPKAIPMSAEPLPEGLYNVEAPLWAGVAGDWTKSLGPGLGPWQCYLAPQQTMVGGRGDFLFHLDSNRSTGSPGSLGCIVFVDQADAQKFLDWQFTGLLYVDWGLGYVDVPDAEGGPKEPAPAAPAEDVWTKVYRKPTALNAYHDGKSMAEGELVIKWGPQGYSQTLNGKPLPNGTTRVEIRSPKK